MGFGLYGVVLFGQLIVTHIARADMLLAGIFLGLSRDAIVIVIRRNRLIT